MSETQKSIKETLTSAGFPASAIVYAIQLDNNALKRERLDKDDELAKQDLINNVYCALTSHLTKKLHDPDLEEKIISKQGEAFVKKLIEAMINFDDKEPISGSLYSMNDEEIATFFSDIRELQQTVEKLNEGLKEIAVIDCEPRNGSKVWMELKFLKN